MTFRIKTLLVVLTLISMAAGYGAYRLKQPLPERQYLVFGVTHGDGGVPSMHLSVEYGHASVNFRNVPPFDGIHECVVSHGGGKSDFYDGPGMPVNQRRHQPLLPEFQERFDRLLALFKSRMTEEQRRFIENNGVVDGKPVPFPPPTQFRIRLNLNRLEAEEPDVDYAYWLTPPDKW